MKTTLPPRYVNGIRADRSPIQIETHQLLWRPAAYALIVDDQGQLLVQDNLWTGRLSFTGGGMEIWESIPECLTREVWEETGLKVQITRLLAVDELFFSTPSGNHWHTLNFYYEAHLIGGELRGSVLADETTANPRWVDPQTLTDHDFMVGWSAIQKLLAG